MRISVVVIVFNLEDFVGQAIESVLNQSRKADEIIVVDDCSTDDTAVRVKAYGDQLHYLRMPENSGALLTALHGVKAATGDVVCMLDGDDIWQVNKLATVEREFKADTDLLLLSHDHIRVDQQGSELPMMDDTHRNIATIRRRARSPAHLSELLKETILEQRGFWLGSAYSFRRPLFDVAKFESQIAPFGPAHLKQTYLDLVIAPFLILTNPGKNVGYTPDTRLSYRLHDRGSMGGNVTVEKALQSVQKGRMINELIDHLLRANQASAAHLRRRHAILEEYDFLSALYEGNYARALRLYWRLARTDWNSVQLKKETKRLVAVLALGPERFLKLKQGRAPSQAAESPTVGGC